MTGLVLAPRPICAAEIVDKYSLEGLRIDEIRKYFGNHVYEVFDESPGRLQEKASGFLDKTRCSSMELAQNGVDDSVFYLEIGNADKFASILFANALRFLPQEHADGMLNDNAYYSFKGASVSGIALLFPPDVCAAIDASNLRAWEKEHFLLETTDCVMMTMSRTKPHWGRIMVRVAVLAAYSMSHILCQ